MMIASSHPRGGIVAHGGRAIAVFALVLAGLQQSARAASVIVDSVGFESPTFVNGDLKPQNGWNKTSEALGPGAGTSTATVESSFAFSGSRAVQVTRGTNSNDWWAVQKGGFPTQRYVTVDWDMAVNQTFTTGLGPFFGINAFDYQANGTGNPAPGVGVLGTLGVDAATGEVLYQAADSGYLTPATFGNNNPAVVNFGAWNHFRIVFDFTSHQYDIFLGGVQLNSAIGFVDQNNTNGGLQDFTDADIAALAGNLDSVSLAATGTAYFDNFVVRDGLLGDYDLNGTVNSADLTTWKQAFGTTVAPAGNNADGNSNGKVDAADYVIWRSRLGTSLFSGSGSGSLSTTAVPEPGTLALLLSGLMTLAYRRVRRSL
jgi:hypothetical protein